MKVDGPDRRAVACCEYHPAPRSQAGRWARPALERAACRLQRRVVDPAHRRAVERFALALWQISNRASAFSELGALRRHGKSAAGPRAGFARARRPGSQRMFHRRHVRAGEKRGHLVGPTKRGKGTKIMGVADGHGLPLAVCTASASPAEVTLVRQTMEERLVADVPERLIGDKAYDSDKLDQEMMDNYGTEMIPPNRADRTQPHDGR